MTEDASEGAPQSKVPTAEKVNFVAAVRDEFRSESIKYIFGLCLSGLVITFVFFGSAITNLIDAAIVNSVVRSQSKIVVHVPVFDTDCGPPQNAGECSCKTEVEKCVVRLNRPGIAGRTLSPEKFKERAAIHGYTYTLTLPFAAERCEGRILEFEEGTNAPSIPVISVVPLEGDPQRFQISVVPELGTDNQAEPIPEVHISAWCLASEAEIRKR